MNRFILNAMVLSLLAVSAPAMADLIIDAGEPTMTRHFEFGATSTGSPRAAGDPYSNIDTFSGSGVANGGAATVSGLLTTRYLADDLNPGLAYAGVGITRFDWCVANFNASATTARMRVRFHQDDIGAGPGTYTTGFSFTATAIPVGVSCFFFDNVNPFMTIPANGRLWAGITFDNSGAAGATAALYNNLGMGLFDPPTQGTSLDKDFLTTAASVGNVQNPVGSVRTSPYAPLNANHGWRLVPEPSSISLLAVGALALIRRRR
ncbi:MAG: PEP-CTERM sorting domain-containing protein [Planctomycetia bacterium]|nr:PEP-CTERM sorting domain-containing protein [Planctomycetia bacterium]MCC7316167.1 PEP-CTERM sorting domain-containing protein [Planctomycetota bacterium]OQZ06505.1 MAG: hypothetical protein B6D36_04660 [Planctomycetes bacterium UTPLA1]